MAKKIFLSPSDQTNNRYAYGNTSEAIQCGKIAVELEEALTRCGFAVRMQHYQTMDAKCANADAWGADLYIPIHTNACNGNVSGTRIYTYDYTGEGRKAGLCVYHNLAPLTPGKSDNISADASLYEIRKPAAPRYTANVNFTMFRRRPAGLLHTQQRSRKRSARACVNTSGFPTSPRTTNRPRQKHYIMSKLERSEIGRTPKKCWNP